MEDNYVGIKELYDINIRLNQPIQIGNRKYDINETILSFESAKISQLQEGKSYREARGGYNNNLLINWEVDKQADFAISDGILSPTTWAILTNSKLNQKKTKSVPFKEQLPVIDDCDYSFVLLKYIPNHIDGKWGIQGNPENEPLPMGRREWLPLKPLPPKRDKYIFCYDLETGNRIMNFEVAGNKVIFKGNHNKVMVDYTFDYEDDIVELDVGNRLFNGFLNLTGKMTTKEHFSGETRTAILEIPRIKIYSNLAIKLGSLYQDPIVSEFYFTGYPEEGRQAENESVCKITFLKHELTQDYV